MENLLMQFLWGYQLSMGDSFVRLFTEMTPIVIVLFILGILFCFVELFVPGFGVFGISGIILLIVAIVLRMIGGGDIFMFVYMFLISLIIIGIMFAIITHSAKKGFLSKTKIFDIGTSVPTGHTEGTKDFSSLMGAQGTALTFLHPVGRADFGGQVEDVIAEDEIIDAGEEIVVVRIEGQKIMVAKLKDKHKKGENK
ncbi:MAG: NfeD family protein [Clostridia bacterium]|nr:NfeD family protein [Clostridia bacterium]